MNWVIVDRWDPGHHTSVSGKVDFFYSNLGTKATYNHSMKCVRGCDSGWAISDEVHEWLEERDPNYQFIYVSNELAWKIGLECDQTAMLFKLTWS